MKAVVLFNLGGPKTLDDVEPFLFNLFADPDVIRLPPVVRWFQKPLARRISRKRAPESQENYKKIGNGSPLLANTEAQARALEAALGEGYKVYVAMRYWHPFAHEAIEAMRADGVEEVVMLPLYPQHSISTTTSSVNDFEAALEAAGWNPPVRLIHHWHDRDAYQRLVAESIATALGDTSPSQAHLLFSAHGVPVSYVTKYGDVYQRHVEETVEGVVKRLPPELSHSLCYQSRVGPVKWLEPDIEQELPRLAQGERKTLLVYPVSFVSEHVETLFELDILYGEPAKELGFDYRRVHTLGDNSELAALLAQLVRESEAGV